MHEVDFSSCNLTEAIFDNCDLTRATFDNTTLDRADLYTAYNFNIDPELNSIKKAHFATSGLYGLLMKYDIKITA